MWFEKSKRGQISTEYLIVIGFIVFLIIGILGVAFFYIGGINDRIKVDQIQNFADKVLSSSESVFYSGEPSRVVVNAYLPSGVTDLEIVENHLVLNVSSSGGENRMAFESNVPISGSISHNEGLKRLSIAAQSGDVIISEVV